MVMSTAWVFTTSIAYAAILRGLVTLHRQWMVRSYLVTFAFVTIRLFMEYLPGVVAHLGGTLPERVINLVWISWSLPLVVFELILQVRRILPARGAAFSQAPTSGRSPLPTLLCF
jgi:hypothetical protein